MQEIKSNVWLKNFDIEDELFFSVSSFIYKSLKNDVNEKQIIHKRRHHFINTRHSFSFIQYDSVYNISILSYHIMALNPEIVIAKWPHSKTPPSHRPGENLSANGDKIWQLNASGDEKFHNLYGWGFLLGNSIVYGRDFQKFNVFLNGNESLV